MSNLGRVRLCAWLFWGSGWAGGAWIGITDAHPAAVVFAIAIGAPSVWLGMRIMLMMIGEGDVR